MKELLGKLKKLELSLSKEKGGFTLFVLINDEELVGKYNLLISAQWLNQNDRETFKYLIEKIKDSVSEKDIIHISRVTVANTNSEIVKSLNSAIHVEHGEANVENCSFNNIFIKKGYFITSNRSSD